MRWDLTLLAVPVLNSAERSNTPALKQIVQMYFFWYTAAADGANLNTTSHTSDAFDRVLPPRMHGGIWSSEQGRSRSAAEQGAAVLIHAVEVVVVVVGEDIIVVVMQDELVAAAKKLRTSSPENAPNLMLFECISTFRSDNMNIHYNGHMPEM